MLQIYIKKNTVKLYSDNSRGMLGPIGYTYTEKYRGKWGKKASLKECGLVKDTTAWKKVRRHPESVKTGQATPSILKQIV